MLSIRKKEQKVEGTYDAYFGAYWHVANCNG
jgi:hypothetical protein